MGDAHLQPGPPILPADVLSARGSNYQRRQQGMQRRRFWLEFSLLPHYPSRKERKNLRKVEKRHRGKDKINNDDYDLHDVPAIRFPQFVRLPAEIRLVVWQYALLHPRIIVITSKYEDYIPPVGTTLDPLTANNYLATAASDFQSPVLTSMSSPPPPWKPPPAQLPSLMLACRESYECARKFYERAFAWRVPNVLFAEDESDDTFVATRDYCAGRALGFFGQPQASSSLRATQQGQQQQQRQRQQHPQNLPPLSSVLGSRYRVRPGSTSTQRSAAKKPPPSGPGCWFNFELDSVCLRGDFDLSLGGATTSMAYFLPQVDTKRVRYVGCNASDLGVGRVPASQLYARLYPIIDRFEIRKCLSIVFPPQIRKLKQNGQSEAERKANELVTTAANMAVSQRNPIGSYGSDGTERICNTQTNCVSVNATDINLYADLNGLECYDINNSICQQAWEQWTNNQNMPLSEKGSRARSAAHARGDDSYSSDSDSDSESECSCDYDIEDAIRDPRPSTNIARGQEGGVDYESIINVAEVAARDGRDDEDEDGARHIGTADNEMDDVGGMNVNAGLDADLTEWAQQDWGSLPPLDQDYIDAAVHGIIHNAPNAQDEDEDEDEAEKPPKETMRMVLVTEDLLRCTLETIEKVRLYAATLGQDT